MTISIDFHDKILRIIQHILTEWVKKKMPDCKGFIMFTLSKLDEDPGPRTAILTNMNNYHSVKLLLELANQHMETKRPEGDGKREKGELWAQCQKRS